MKNVPVRWIQKAPQSFEKLRKKEQISYLLTEGKWSAGDVIEADGETKDWYRCGQCCCCSCCCSRCCPGSWWCCWCCSWCCSGCSY